MSELNRVQTGLNRVLFPRLSIQYRLPLLICILLLVVIIAVSWTSYIGMRNSAREVGRQRLLTLTEQLSSMFQQSARQVRANMRSAASHEAIRSYLMTASEQAKDSSYDQLKKLKVDTTVMEVQLLNLYRQPVLSIKKPGVNINIDIDSSLRATSAAPEFTTVGKLYLAGDSMYYPIIVAVTHSNNKPIGHIVQWRLVTATQKSLELLSKIIGTDGSLYIGNYDGSLWTNTMKPVSLPVFEKTGIPNVVGYKRNGNQMIASVRPITNTSWMVLVEFPRKSIDEAANSFLLWIVGAGFVLLVISMLLAWTMSRNITRPLKQLTSAATAIASGNTTTEVNVDRSDELGKLARAFNAMSIQVENAQRDLENKVKDRTAKLEAVNKELEAFSYSVSHDLRAPLRAVNGYAQILKEDYGPGMDAEANRIINAIMSNAHMMGQLIDDLIAFSRISRKELAHNTIDMTQLAETCVQEIQETNGRKKYEVQISKLPTCLGDQSMMKQVWLNLISNAVKYSSQEAAPQIQIGYKDEGNGHHVYFVKDNGVGFDMQYAHKLFGVFQRLHSPEAFEGTGVGLALAKRIINKHAGDIWAESAPGKGATFFISLPKTVLND
jgi:signal transduction histidine kinase